MEQRLREIDFLILRTKVEPKVYEYVLIVELKKNSLIIKLITSLVFNVLTSLMFLMMHKTINCKVLINSNTHTAV